MRSSFPASAAKPLPLVQVNFMSLFTSVHPNTDTSSPGHCRLVQLWLELLGHLTLFTDGQQMAAWTPGELRGVWVWLSRELRVVVL